MVRWKLEWRNPRTLNNLDRIGPGRSSTVAASWPRAGSHRPYSCYPPTFCRWISSETDSKRRRIGGLPATVQILSLGAHLALLGSWMYTWCTTKSDVWSCNIRHSVSFPAARCHWHLTSTNWHCLPTEAHMCEQLVVNSCMSRVHNRLITSSTPWSSHYATLIM